jgi:1-pyrroline-4-hydroxy-2-carboxylate deaminase
MDLVQWKGVYPAVLTPFDDDGAIDFSTFKLNTLAQIEAGVDGIVLNGTLGEASTLEGNERLELLKYARTLVQDQVPVIMNIAEQSTRGAIEAARLAEEAGADGLMLLPPMRYKSDDRETVQFFCAVAANTSLPIMIYNNPIDYRVLVTLDMFESMQEYPNIQAVKESTRDLSNITRMRNRFGNRYKIMCGVDPIAMESLCVGADGWVAGLSDALPRETVAIYRLIVAGRIEEALSIHRWFFPLFELDIHPKLVQYIKLVASFTGLCTENVRAPRLILEGAERRQIEELIKTSLANRPELPDYLNLSAMHSALSD